MGESTYVCPSPATTQEWKSEGFERVCGNDWYLLSLTQFGMQMPPPPAPRCGLLVMKQSLWPDSWLPGCSFPSAPGQKSISGQNPMP